jgi:hypothetical protein
MITLFNNYTNKPTDTHDINTLDFEKLVELFSKDKTSFLKDMKQLNYIKNLNSLHSWAFKTLSDKKYETLIKFPFLLSFFLNELYSETIVDYTKILFFNTDTTPFSKTDFKLPSDFPDHVFNVIVNNCKKGRYSLYKTLQPVFVNAMYTVDAKNKNEKNLALHAQLFALDIDLKPDNDLDLFNAINKNFEIYTTLYTTSNALRPVIRFKVDDKTLKRIAKVLNKTEKFETIKNEVMVAYHNAFFNYVSETLKQETITINGIQENLLIDSACSNTNRLWYISHNTKNKIINTKAKEYDLTDEQFLKYYKVEKSITKKIFENNKDFENIKIADLTDIQRNEIQETILNTSSKILELCKKNEYQFLYDGSNMYNSVRDMYFSIASFLDKENLEYIFIEFFKLSKNDNRLTHDYQSRDINYLKGLSLTSSTTVNSFKHIFTVYNSLNDKFNPKITYSLVYYNEKEKKLLVNYFERDRFLEDTFFRIKNDKALYTKEKHLVKKISYLVFDLHIFYSFLDKKIDDLYLNQDIIKEQLHAIKRIIKNSLTTDELNKINFPIVDPSKLLENDTKDTIFLYTKDCKLIIKKDSITEIDYTEKDFIFEENITKNKMGDFIKYDKRLDYNNYKSLEFYKKMSGDITNFIYCKSLIGYLTSTYRSSNDSKVVFLLDGIDSSENGGGTGKSLMTRNIEYVRNTYNITNPKYSNFIWSKLINQKNVILNDVSWNNFSIENIKPFTDLDLTCEEKGKPNWQLRFNDCPKVSLSTNFLPNSFHESFLSRCLFFYPTTFFNRLTNPADIYLQTFYNTKNPYKILEYETKEEWELWLSFIVNCSQTFLENGVDKYNSLDKFNEKNNNENQEFLPFMLLSNHISFLIDEIEKGNFNTYFKMDKGSFFIQSTLLITGFNSVLKNNNLKIIERIGTKYRKVIEDKLKELGYSFRYSHKDVIKGETGYLITKNNFI